MASVRRIGVITATRAEYDLLSPLLLRLRDDPAVDLQLIVSGTHLAPEFGSTADAVAADAVPVAARLETVLSSDSPVGSTKSAGLTLIGLADLLDRLTPDVLVIGGDRSEAVAAAVAGVIAGVPVAHIGGGQVTEGAYDESFRHAIAKLAQLHFPATAEFARRIVQMGEEPSVVHVVGALGIDNVLGTPRLDRSSLERELRLVLRRPTLLVTYHPATRGASSPERAVRTLLSALDEFPHASVVFTGTNSDPGGRSISAEVARYMDRRGGTARSYPSLGRRLYLSLVRESDVLVGNSSSGIIEAPALGTPTVNIGDRQRGRPRAPSVIDCAEVSQEIVAGIRRALSGAVPRGTAEGVSGYGDGHAAERIARILSTVDLSALAGQRFRDLPAGR